MQRKRFLAALLVLMMVFSLLPASAVTAYAEDEDLDQEPAPAEEEVVLEETAPDLTEPEEETPEAVTAPTEPQAVTYYDLWVYGVQVNSGNKNYILDQSAIVFDPTTNTLTIRSTPTKHLTEVHEDSGAVIYSELPYLNIVSTSTAASNSSADNGVTLPSDVATTMIYVKNGPLTLTMNPGVPLVLNSSSATKGIYVESGDMNLNGNVVFKSSTLTTGIDVPNGDLIVNSAQEEGRSILVKGADGSSTATVINVPTGAATVYGNLELNFYFDESVETGILVKNGLTVTGDLDICVYNSSDAYAVKATEGPVSVSGDAIIKAGHTGIYCGRGSVTVGGSAGFMGNSQATLGFSPAAGIYAKNGGVDVGSFSFYGAAVQAIDANGPVKVRGKTSITNEAGFFGFYGIVSTSGGVDLQGDVSFEGRARAVDAGDSTQGIIIGGSFTCNAYNDGDPNPLLNAPGGPVTVGGAVKIIGEEPERPTQYTYAGGTESILAKGDITIGGNVLIHNGYSKNGVRGMAMKSTDGSVSVTGDCTCWTPGAGIYAKNDISITGNTEFKLGTGSVNEYGVKAETGTVTIGGTLTEQSSAAAAVYGYNGISVNGNVTITKNAGDYGMVAPNGKIQLTDGTKWEVTSGGTALRAKNGIEYPEGNGVTLPLQGRLAQPGDLDGDTTVVEINGTVADHVIITTATEQVNYFLIGPDWTVGAIDQTLVFAPNEGADGEEYILKTTLTEGQTIKVVKAVNGAITNYYPEGYETEYTVDAAHAGLVNIYFRPAGDYWNDFHFGGFFYIEKLYTVTVKNDGNGSGYATPKTPAAGATVTLTADGDPYDFENGLFYELDRVEFYKKTGEGANDKELVNASDLQWNESANTFVMPAYDLIIELHFSDHHEHVDNDNDALCDNGGERLGVVVTTTSSARSTLDGPTVATVQGGAVLYFADHTSTTLVASEVDGYAFVGWYLNGEPFSTEMTVEYTPTGNETTDSAFVALYASTKTYRLTVTGTKFTISGMEALQRDYFDDQYPGGTSVTVTYLGNENFLYWINGSKKVVSTNPEYSFLMVNDTELFVVCVDPDTGTSEAMVVFMNSRSNSQVLASHYYTSNETILFPTVPPKMGRPHIGWSMTEDEIKAAMATNSYIAVYAEYAAPTGTYTVTVKNNKNSDEVVSNPISASTEYTVTADSSLGTFSYWMLNGKIVSYNTSIVVRSERDLVLTAMYDQENVEPVPIVTLTDYDGVYDGSKFNMYFIAMRCVPEDYTVSRQGFVYTWRTDLDDLNLSEYLVLGNTDEAVKTTSGSDTSNNGVNLLSSSRDYAIKLTVRAYIVVTKDGESTTYYSDEIYTLTYTP